MHYDTQSADRVKLLLWDGTGLMLVSAGRRRWYQR